MNDLDLTVIWNYQDFWGETSTKNRMDLISDIPKRELLSELAGLNYRLQPKNSLELDISKGTQIKELEWFCRINEHLLQVYLETYHRLSQNCNISIIFNHPANLFAMEEIITKHNFDIQDDFKWNNKQLENFLDYLLLVNTEITKTILPENPTIEDLNASALALNDMRLIPNHIITTFRGDRLLNFFSEHSELKEHFENYFRDTFGI